MRREDWDALIERVCRLEADAKEMMVKPFWSTIDQYNKLGWNKFTSDDHICIAWMIYHAAFWAERAMGLLRSLMQANMLARTGVEMYINRQKDALKKVLKEFASAAIRFVFLNFPVPFPVDQSRCIGFAEELIDAFKTVREYDEFLMKIRDNAKKIYKLYEPSNDISEKVPMEFVPKIGKFMDQIHDYPVLYEFYKKFMEAAARASSSTVSPPNIEPSNNTDSHETQLVVSGKRINPATRTQTSSKSTKTVFENGKPATVTEEITNDGNGAETITITKTTPDGKLISRQSTTKTTTKT